MGWRTSVQARADLVAVMTALGYTEHTRTLRLSRVNTLESAAGRFLVLPGRASGPLSGDCQDVGRRWTLWVVQRVSVPTNDFWARDPDGLLKLEDAIVDALLRAEIVEEVTAEPLLSPDAKFVVMTFEVATRYERAVA